MMITLRTILLNLLASHAQRNALENTAIPTKNIVPKASLINSVTLQALRRVWPQGAVVQEGWLPFKRL
jgi:hypothetical protein